MLSLPVEGVAALRAAAAVFPAYAKGQRANLRAALCLPEQVKSCGTLLSTTEPQLGPEVR